MPAGAAKLTYPVMPAVARPITPTDSSDTNPLRRITFVFALGLIFVRFGMLPFLLLYVAHSSFYIMYLFGIPSLLGIILAGGIQQAFRGRPPWFWTGYALWLIAAIPFSTWKGGSLDTVLGFLKVEFPMLFVLGGLAVTWRECRRILHVIAFGAMVCLASGWLMRKETGNSTRLSLELGTMGNANDFAAHLLIVLPFLLWVALTSKVTLLRILALAGVGTGYYMVLMSGSRGASLALAASILFVLLWAPGRWRVVLLVGAPVVIAILVSVVPMQIWMRIFSFSTDAPDTVIEAAESMQLRQILLRRSLMDTLSHPVFGVGPAQFSNFEGELIKSWRVPHNTFTEISSECGVPALILYLGGIISSFSLFGSTYRRARRLKLHIDIRNGAFCAMLAMLGYVVSSAFLSLAYMFYLPAMGGLAVALFTTARREMDDREAREAEQAPATLYPQALKNLAPPRAGTRLRGASV